MPRRPPRAHFRPMESERYIQLTPALQSRLCHSMGAGLLHGVPRSCSQVWRETDFPWDGFRATRHIRQYTPYLPRGYVSITDLSLDCHTKPQFTKHRPSARQFAGPQSLPKCHGQGCNFTFLTTELVVPPLYHPPLRGGSGYS